MSIARHHSEWLSLVEVSGPFLSMPVLMRVFPQGLVAHDPEKFRSLKLAFEEWQANNEAGRHTNPAIHIGWIKFVLTMILGLPAESILEHQAIPQSLAVTPPGERAETVRPSLVLIDPVTNKPRLLIQSYPADQNLDKPVAGRTWPASPGTRMMELCHATGVRLGLVTNGERWMLVDAPRNETTGFASWYATLWTEEPITLRAFVSLLSADRFSGVAEKDTIEALLAESANNQHEVTDQLGYQVRTAVEVLVQAIDRIDQDRDGQLLKGVDEKLLYEAALTYMMRLVFLFSADERRLFPLDNELYAIHYAASTLGEQLRKTADDHGEEVLERRHDAWSRLLSTFRLIYGGCEHPELRMPSYAGNLFDPDRFPFLEGRPVGTRWTNCEAEPPPVNNRTVLHLLEALQLLRVKVPGSSERQARRLSFRALDIEQIGHVYEGLLDHTAKRASEPMLGLAGGRDREPEIPLSTLEDLLAQDREKLIEYLSDQTGRSESAIAKALAEESDPQDAGRLRVACGNGEKLFTRVQPFAGLIRRDTYDYPTVIRKGSVFVTSGTDRRSSGTHYTPRSLTEPIVKYTLEPLVYFGPAEGKPQDQWQLRAARELLDLKICDMACGSGAFLVQACRYLSERLLEAWEIAEKNHPAPNPGKLPFPTIMAEGKPSTGAPGETLIPKNPDERMAYAKRSIAQRCLYGVDINPLATEMAKLSLWLLTMAKDKPFTFLDHAIRCGDSLLGVSSVKQIENFSLRPGEQQATLGTLNLFRYTEGSAENRRALEELPSNDHTQIETKTRLHAEAEAATAKVKALADCLIAFELRGLDGDAYEEQRTEEAEKVQQLMKRDADASLQSQTLTINQLFAHAREQLRGRRPFHWSVEFPEVIGNGGFDAFVGNPPFMGGRLVGRALGDDYHDFIALLRSNMPGSPDLCAYFILRAYSLLNVTGYFGLLATKTISETGTRSVCLDRLIENGASIFRAFSRYKWPGVAAVVVSVIHVAKGQWNGTAMLDDETTDSIDGGLVKNFVVGTPFPLLAMKGQFSQGQDLMGRGFELNEEERRELLATDPTSSAVVYALFNGQDLNTMPELKPYRWAIYFKDMPEHEARGHVAAFSRLEQLVKPYRDGLTGQIHQDCFWKFWDLRPKLMREVECNTEILASAVVTKFVSFRRVPTNNVYNHKTKLYFFYAWRDFAVLQSALHQEWAHWRCATLGATTFSYSTSAALETWPMPISASLSSSSLLDHAGQNYHHERETIMQARQEGLTKTYNRFHDRGEQSADIARLRALHVEMDQAVAASYGWSDLDLGRGFHATKQGERYTISEPARREVLTRLLKLNHERYAEEVAQWLHDKGKGRGKAKPKTSKPRQPMDEVDLFAPTHIKRHTGDGDSPADDQAGEADDDADEQSRERPVAIDEVDTDQAMAAFRHASRGSGSIGRDELLKAVSERLGYERLGSKVKERLKGHLRAALRRKVLESDGEMVKIATSTMSTYWDQYRDEFIEQLLGVMRTGQRYERDEVIYGLAARLGFERVKGTVEEPIGSAINGAIRRGLIQSEGNTIWRD